MWNNKKKPKFPYSYIGKKAEEYETQKWMERNQKKTTIKCVQYLFDEKLGDTDLKSDFSLLTLDLGCGTGFSSEVLIEQGFRVVGIDVLIDMLSIANDKKKKYGLKQVELILADINHLPIKNHSIDNMISISAYNFIAHGARGQSEKIKILNNTVKHLNKILKKGGRIVIEFYPNDDKELELFKSSFVDNGFDGFVIKKDPNQKSGQTYLLLKK